MIQFIIIICTYIGSEESIDTRMSWYCIYYYKLLKFYSWIITCINTELNIMNKSDKRKRITIIILTVKTTNTKLLLVLFVNNLLANLLIY